MNLFQGKPKKHPDFEVTWDEEADDILRKSGNYTLEQIHNDFELDPLNRAVKVDPDLPYFVTPVLDRRYSVIWQLSEGAEKKIAKVSAVVPLRFAGVAEGLTLKQRVKTAVQRASNGRVALDF